MVYEIWRDDSLNLSAAFKTEREALTALREEVVRNGPEVVLRSVLVKADARGNRTEIAEGRELVERALTGRTTTNGRRPPAVPAADRRRAS